MIRRHAAGACMRHAFGAQRVAPRAAAAFGSVRLHRENLILAARMGALTVPWIAASGRNEFGKKCDDRTGPSQLVMDSRHGGRPAWRRAAPRIGRLAAQR